MKKAEVTFNKLGFKTHVMDSELAPYKTKEQLLIECKKTKDELCIHLLYNGKLSIKNAYSLFGISNISREIRRQIEIPLNIELKRVKKVGKTRYKKPCYWFEYSATDLNKIALKKALGKN